MLDADTKRRIDTARDILVGKVPDPKSQVEQITIALIYKFMDDIDAESEELGGERTFFSGDFARYGWARLMHPGLGGYETLNLYADGIDRMPENHGIPPLFRDIFNNAYLPYRDPETLRAFLKVIDEFTYDHSERLGDAFEYLLSVLGSQGDAGQFRTPRHIIDFIVSIVDPKKDEVVLDPACGTAGFLISSYKHILDANTDEEGNSALTPGDRERLAANFQGYDISPDMVRLSLVNMYLHGFVDPHIFEYDTLTSDDRWDEYADVILANPPFMSPKGGIRPHSRFSVKSKRSEVLFVDYMAEHLSPAGRAGIIVPEGIIFQSQKAHKQLRKMLVEGYLVAVVSLPAGVFNPYSGVKTSILVLDKALAAKTDRIAFFKVENDGFHLGAQRRPIDRNDLPQVQAEVAEYLRNLRAGEPTARVAESSAEYRAGEPTDKVGLVVEKDKVAADGEYNLSGERYRERSIRSTDWPMASLGTVVDVESGSRQKGGAIESGIPSIGGEQINENGRIRFDKMKYVSEEHFKGMKKGILRSGDVLIVKDGATTGKVGLFSHDIPAAVNEHVFILRAKQAIHPYYAYSVVRSEEFQERLRPLIKGIIGGISLEVRDLEIPLPPLEVQKEIVAEIEGYQKVIDGARAVVDNYRPRIAIDPEWPMVALGGICERLQYGLSTRLNTQGTGYRTFRMSELVGGQCVDCGDMKCADISAEEFEKYRLRRGDILFNRTNSFEHVGRTGAFNLDGEYCFASYLIRLSISEESANPFYVNALMNTDDFQSGIKRYASRAIGQSNINARALAAYRIPVPSLTIQQAVIAEIEAERALVDANRELIERFERKIRDVIERVWDEAPI